MTANGSLPAYPTNELRGDRGDYRVEAVGGLTKRELFAAMAMQGRAALPATSFPQGDSSWAELDAQMAVAYADALLAELAKEIQP